MLTLGGLFSGVGGFELAWQRNGGRVAWMCEIDPKARKVLEHRFPAVPIYHDVTQLDPHEVEPVDVLTGGSPCQGFSIAGGRKGLEHHESRLFADHIRIMDGLAERGLQWAVWENVPGVLSISNDDGERTFPHVVAALVGADRPVHLDGRTRWNTGLADGGSRAVAWRVLDSRHFGVPQRRRRVYACVAFGNSAANRAGRALLAVPESVRGDSPSCGQAGKDVAGTLGGGAGNRGWPQDTDRMTFVPDQAQCVTTGTGMRYDPETETLVPQVAHTLRGEGFDASEDGTGRGTPLVPQPMGFHESGQGWWKQDDVAGTLRAEGENRPSRPSNVVGVPQPMGFYPTAGTHGVSPNEDGSPSLKVGTGSGGDAPAVLLTMREGKDGGGKGPLLSEDESLTLSTGNGQVLFEPQGVDFYNHAVTGDVSHCLRSGATDGYGAVIDSVTPGGYSASHADATQARSRAVLRRLRDALGPKAAQEWQARVLDSLQQAAVLRPGVHEGGFPPEAEDGRRELVNDASAGTAIEAGWAVRGVRECVERGRPPHRPQLAEQLAGELEAALSELSPPSAREGVLDLGVRSEAQGPWVLREALSAVQEVGRPAGGEGQPAPATVYGVRRLTPVEAERLQAFPDGWTEPAGSDSARYRALGNAVTVSVPEWLFGRMLKVQP